MMYQRLCFAASLVLLAGMLGCEQKAKVEAAAGTITFNGTPVKEGTVVFQDLAKGISVTADLNSEGKYSFATLDGPGLPAGTYQVGVRPPEIVRPIGSMEVIKPVQYPNLPPKFRDPANSGLTAAVGPEHKFDFDLAK